MTSISAAGPRVAPQFGAIIRINSDHPDRARSYGENLVKRLQTAPTAGGNGSPILQPAPSLTGLLVPGEGGSTPQGFLVPGQKGHQYCVVADFPGTTPHATLYNHMLGAWTDLPQKPQSGSTEEMMAGLESIQQALAQQAGLDITI
jgi:hypothetical protein